MSRRLGTILLLAFQALWLNVILPGHTRGIVTMPGWKPAACHAETAATSCCASPDEPFDDKPGTPDNERAANCAVCFFAARLTTPPGITFDLTPGTLLAVRPAPVFEAVDAVARGTCYFGRAPPLA